MYHRAATAFYNRTYITISIHKHSNKYIIRKINRSIENIQPYINDKKWNQKNIKECDKRNSHTSSKHHMIYRMSIKSFPDYKHLLQENCVEYNYIFLPLLRLVSKILSCVYFNICNIWFWMQHFQTGGLGEMVRQPSHHDRQISPPFTSFYGGMLRTKCFWHQFQILQILRQE